MKRFMISGYDKDNDVFEDFETFKTLKQAEEKFEFYKDLFHSNKLKSNLGELIDFIAIYDIKTNERLEIEEW